MNRALRVAGTTVVEAVRVGRSQPVLSAAVAIVSAATVVTTLLSAGQTVIAESRVADEVGGIQARVIEVRSTGSPVIDPTTVADVARLSSVEWVLGLGAPFAIHVPTTPGREVPAVTIVGAAPGLPTAVEELTGAAFVSRRSARELGLTHAVGSLLAADDAVYHLAGAFDARSPLEQLDRFVVIPAASEPVRPLARLDRMVVLALTPADVEVTAALLPALLGTDAPGSVTIEEPAVLIDARSAAAGTLGRFGRAIVLQVLGAGMLLVAITVLSGTMTRQPDFGRRRALGASRSALAGLVLAQTAFAASAGTIVGSVIGTIILDRRGDPPLPYVVAVGSLTVLGAVVAAVVPALAIARRDPLKVLRAP